MRLTRGGGPTCVPVTMGVPVTTSTAEVVLAPAMQGPKELAPVTPGPTAPLPPSASGIPGPPKIGPVVPMLP